MTKCAPRLGKPRWSIHTTALSNNFNLMAIGAPGADKNAVTPRAKTNSLFAVVLGDL